MYGAIPGVEGPTGPKHVLGKRVEPPLERECGRPRDYIIAVGRAQAELHDEEEEDEPLQRKLNGDEGLALATRLYIRCRMRAGGEVKRYRVRIRSRAT